MIGRDKFLVVHGADPVRFAKRWGIEPATCSCHKCGAEQTTSIPFAVGNRLRGLIAPTCSCGHPTPPYCVVATSGDIIEALGQEGED